MSELNCQAQAPVEKCRLLCPRTLTLPQCGLPAIQEASVAVVDKGVYDESGYDDKSAEKGEERRLLSEKYPDPDGPENGLQENDDAGLRGRELPGEARVQGEGESGLKEAEVGEDEELSGRDCQGLRENG